MGKGLIWTRTQLTGNYRSQKAAWVGYPGVRQSDKQHKCAFSLNRNTGTAAKAKSQKRTITVTEGQNGGFPFVGFQFTFCRESTADHTTFVLLIWQSSLQSQNRVVLRTPTTKPYCSAIAKYNESGNNNKTMMFQHFASPGLYAPAHAEKPITTPGTNPTSLTLRKRYLVVFINRGH